MSHAVMRMGPSMPCEVGHGATERGTTSAAAGRTPAAPVGRALDRTMCFVPGLRNGCRRRLAGVPREWWHQSAPADLRRALQPFPQPGCLDECAGLQGLG